jgi:hypothetical protein
VNVPYIGWELVLLRRHDARGGNSWKCCERKKFEEPTPHTYTRACLLLQIDHLTLALDSLLHHYPQPLLVLTSLINMLSSCARPLSRVLGSSAVKSAPKASSHTLPASKASNSVAPCPTLHPRFYAGHGHHEEAPKPYKRTTLTPRLSDSTKSEAELEREVKGIEGWIFGRKVTYIDPLKPLEQTEEHKNANGWLWNKQVRFRPSHSLDSRFYHI